MKKKQKKSLSQKYTPSNPCSCEICVSYCRRPGWWTVEEAAKAVNAGYAPRMMLEMSEDNSFGVISPAFKGCEQSFAKGIFAANGCNFLADNRCELFGTGHQPLECRYCHHDRRGMGNRCHADIAADWNTEQGRAIVVQWTAITDFWHRLSFLKK